MKYSKSILIDVFIIIVLIPATIFVGFYIFNDRKYYFISLLILFYTMIPLIIKFEKRKPQARELMVISVLSAIGVAGRSATFMIRPFAPINAITIISGITLGPEEGFLIGAMIMFVSNFFFGQGPWTPWQMFALGTIGFLSGVFHQKGIIKENKKSLCIFGGLATFFVYGGIMNPAALIMWQSYVTLELIIAYYISGITYDLVHASGTVLFLYLISQPMIEKIDCVKYKYGLFQPIKEAINEEKN